VSDIIITRSPAGKASVAQSLAQLRFVDWTRTAQADAASFRFGVAWIDAPGLRPLAHVPELGVSLVMLGRLYDRTDDRRLDKVFDRIARDYRRRGAEALCPVNGAGALILFDHRSDTCFLVTDRPGALALFVAYPESPEKTAVCSHADVLAARYNGDLQLDPVSMAEFLSMGGASSPHTFYQGLKRLDFASVYRWNSGGWQKVTTYWKPEPRLESFDGVENAARRTADAVRRAVRIRTANVDGRTGLLLSGGLDSRSILYAGRACDAIMTCVTFADQPNREVRYARQLARNAGRPHVFLKRSPEYYGDNAIGAVRTSGGMWDFRHCHAFGFRNRIHDLGLGLVLTGCYADILLKGVVLEKDLYRKPPLFMQRHRFGRLQHHWHKNKTRIEDPRMHRLVRNRLEAVFAGIDRRHPSLADRLRVEHRRAIPFSTIGTIGMHTTLWRTVPFDIVLADDAVLDLFERIPPSVKLNRGLYRRMLAELSPRALDVPNANTGIRADISPMVELGIRLVRKAHRILSGANGRRHGNPLATNESWVNWEYYFTSSPVVHDLWDQARESVGDLVPELLGIDPFAESLTDLASRHALLARVLTLGLWMRHRIRSTTPQLQVECKAGE